MGGQPAVADAGRCPLRNLDPRCGGRLVMVNRGHSLARSTNYNYLINLPD